MKKYNKGVKFNKRIIKVHLPIGIVAMLLLLFLGNTNKLGEAHVIYRWQGIVLLLFTVLYICSNITMHIFAFWGLTYRNPSNTTFNIALFSFLVLLVINYLIKKKFDKK